MNSVRDLHRELVQFLSIAQRDVHAKGIVFGLGIQQRSRLGKKASHFCNGHSRDCGRCLL
jgi:hypothetical protein